MGWISWLQSQISTFLACGVGSFPNRPRRTRQARPTVSGQFRTLPSESLEQRVLLSGVEFIGKTLWITGTSGADTIEVWNATGVVGGTITVDSHVHVTLNGQTTSYAADQVNGVIIDARAGEDSVIGTHRSANRLMTLNMAISGGEGDDFLAGGTGRDTISGDAGDDTIHGWLGNDHLDGDAGQDRVFGGQGDDRLDGGVGDDVLVGEAGNDALLGEDGNDRLEGGDGDDTLLGLNGDDYLSGGAGDDVLAGHAGSDQLFGDAGHDEIEGGDGADRIHGGDGHDLLLGGVGHDQIDGGDDRDLIVGGDGDDFLEGDDGVDLIFGGQGHDAIYGHSRGAFQNRGTGGELLVGGAGNDTLYGTTGGSGGHESNTESLHGDGKDAGGRGQIWGDFVLQSVLNRFNTTAQGTALFNLGHAKLSGEIDDIAHKRDGQAGHDVIHGSTSSDYIVAGGGHDVVFAGGGPDVVYGQGGNDRIHGERGNDHIHAGIGDDHVSGGEGNDRISDLRGEDRLHGNAGNDMILSGDGNDDLHGEEGNDTILVGTVDWTTDVDAAFYVSFGQTIPDDFAIAGPSRIYAGDGHDTVYGSNGDESIWGGAGNDYILPRGGLDRSYGGDGADNIVRRDSEDVIVMGAEALAQLSNPTYFDLSATGSGQGAVAAAIDSQGQSVLTITGTDGGDHIFVDWVSTNGGQIRIWINGVHWHRFDFGGVSQQLLVELQSQDARFRVPDRIDIHTLEGGDTIEFSEAVRAHLAHTVSEYHLGSGGGYASGHDGAETYYGGAQIDEFYGHGGNDTAYTYAGNDSITGGDGNDIVFSGDGDDHVIGGLGGDTIHGGNGNDILYGAFAGSVDPTVINSSRHDGDRHNTIDGGGGNDLIIGGDAADTIAGGDGDNRIFGRRGNDQVTSGSGRDVIHGGLGDDTVSAGAGEDSVWGESGNDSLSGGDGDDQLFGGDGADNLQGQGHDDQLVGGAGDDNLQGGDGVDAIHGGDGHDTIEGGLQSDAIFGGAGNDRLYGHTEANPNGSADDDFIVGGEGDDHLYGANGTSDVNGGSHLYGDTILLEEFQDAVQATFAHNPVDAFPFPYVQNRDVDAGGADTIIGGSNNDFIFGGGGRDHLEGGSGDDQIHGGSGNDLIFGDLSYIDYRGKPEVQNYTYSYLLPTLGTVHQWGNEPRGTGDDVIFGNAGNDELYGGHGHDRLYGEEGDDTLDPSTGDNELFGGEGDDQFVGGERLIHVQQGNLFRWHQVSGRNLYVTGNGNDRLYNETRLSGIHSSQYSDTWISPGDELIEVSLHSDDPQILVVGVAGSGNETFYKADSWSRSGNTITSNGPVTVVGGHDFNTLHATFDGQITVRTREHDGPLTPGQRFESVEISTPKFHNNDGSTLDLALDATNALIDVAGAAFQTRSGAWLRDRFGDQLPLNEERTYYYVHAGLDAFGVDTSAGNNALGQVENLTVSVFGEGETLFILDPTTGTYFFSGKKSGQAFAFGVSTDDGLTFPSEHVSSYLQDDAAVSGDLFVSITDWDVFQEQAAAEEAAERTNGIVPSFGVTVDGSALVDLQEGVNYASLWHSLFGGDVPDFSLDPSELQRLVNATSDFINGIDRIAIAGSVSLDARFATSNKKSLLNDLPLFDIEYEIGRGSAIFDFRSDSEFAYIFGETTNGPLDSTVLAPLVGGVDGMLDLRLGLTRKNLPKTELKYTVSHGSNFFHAEVTGHGDVSFNGHLGRFGQAFDYTGHISSSGVIDFRAHAQSRGDFNLHIAHVSWTSDTTVAFHGQWGDGAITASFDSRLSFEGTRRVWFTKWGLSGITSVDATFLLADWGRSDFDLDLDVHGSLTLYYGFGSVSLGADLDASIRSDGFSIHLPHAGTISV